MLATLLTEKVLDPLYAHGPIFARWAHVLASRRIAGLLDQNAFAEDCQQLPDPGPQMPNLVHGEDRPTREYSKRLTRAVAASLREVPGRVAKDFEVTVLDLEFCTRVISSVDLATLRDKHPEPLPQHEVARVLKDCREYCRRLAYSKLRFLSENDGALCNSDLASELMTAAVRAATRARYEGNVELMRNYCHRAIYNQAAKILRDNTREARATLVAVESSERVYQRRVVSLSASDNHEVVGSHRDDDALAVFSDIEGNNLVRFVADNVPPKVRRFIEVVVLEQRDHGFELWCEVNGHAVEDQDIATYARLAREFFGVDRKTLQKHVGRALAAIGRRQP